MKKTTIYLTNSISKKTDNLVEVKVIFSGFSAGCDYNIPKIK